jgi:hypothetical protein
MLKRNVPLIIVFLTAVILIVAFFIPHRPFGDLESRFLNWYAIVAGFTLLLGLDSLTRHHVVKVFRRTPGWFHSLLLILSLIATVTLGLYSWFKYRTPFDLRAPFMWLYTFMIVPLQSTMFASLAFFIVSAAYRAFRIRNFAATLLLIAACMVMIGNVPLGGTLWRGIGAFVHLIIPGVDVARFGGLEGFAAVKDWLMSTPQAAAARGIAIGLSLGGIAMSLRIILGIERSYMS